MLVSTASSPMPRRRASSAPESGGQVNRPCAGALAAPSSSRDCFAFGLASLPDSPATAAAAGAPSLSRGYAAGALSDGATRNSPRSQASAPPASRFLNRRPRRRVCGPAATIRRPRSPPPPMPSRGPRTPPVISEEAFADAAAGERERIVVTGSRVRRPNLSSASPVSVIGAESADGYTAGRSKARPPRRGDWNACTIDDPSRDLGTCGKRAGAAGSARPGAAAEIADGCTRVAGSGGRESSNVDCVAPDPRSPISTAPRRAPRGDLDRALADLNQAVR